MNGLDLFSGIGGISLALSEWVKTIAYCESDRYAQSVLISRMLTGQLDRAPIWDDVRSLTGLHVSDVDIIYGGFPCQDISVAGNGVGLAGERSGLFFEIIRLVKEISPRFVFLENVPAIRTRGLLEVVNAFTEIGYDCRWTCVSAAEVGTPHRRERWFLLAHSSSDRRNSNGSRKLESYSENDPNPMLPRLEGQREESGGEGSKLHDTCDNSWWTTEPDVGRVVNGLPMRVDRIKCLGNSVVPKQAKEAFERLMGIKPT